MRKSLVFIPALYLLSAQGAHCEDFHGQNCFDGCPEMKAGYKWAQDQDAHDPYLCIGRTRDFEKGCSAYVLEAGPKMPPPKQQDDDRDPDDQDNDSQPQQ
ncbi:MAG: hypothetical protein QM780_17440 [Hyphomicrobium sp.]|uniref:hypothetical protein n=1 Tax=Hyphomicrobium sp. TaxID=82 RepID=UPI0039E48F1D